MKEFIIILFLIAISTTASANTKELILKTCQDLIKKDTKIHPRLINIEKHGEYKYTFDVVFIQKGKEVDRLKDSFFDKNYSCEYYPEEGTIYKQFSDKQLADDKAKREAEAKNKAEEKVIRDAKIAEARAKEKTIQLAKKAQLEADRRAKVAEADRIKKENVKKEKIEKEAAAKLELIRNEKIQAERIKQKRLKKEGDELAFKYKEQAKICVKNDAERVKIALLSVLSSIHRPGAIHIEDWKITKLSFLKNINIMKVAYNFKIYTQIQFRNDLGEKSEPIGLKDTQDIDVKPYGRSTAIATCRIK